MNPKRLLLALPIPVVLIVLVFVTGGMSQCVASCDGYKDELLTTVEACPAARDALGDSVHYRKLSYACGSSETSGGGGRSSWDIALTGAKGNGRLSYDAEKHGGNWVFTSMTLDAGDAKIDILACGRDAKSNASVTSASWNGSVLRSTHDKVGESASCAGKLDRDGDRAHLLVHCAGMVVYDGSGDFDGTPATQTISFTGKGAKLKLTEGHGTAVLNDAGSEIVISIQ